MIVVSVVKMFAPVRVRLEVPLFCVTPVTLDPMTELINVPPVPVPEWVTVLVLFKLPVLMLMPAELVELFARTSAFAPVIPPLMVSTPVPAVWIVLAAVARINGVLIPFVALLPAETRIPSKPDAPVPPMVREVPPVKV